MDIVSVIDLLNTNKLMFETTNYSCVAPYLIDVFVLLAIFEIKHLFADFVFQTEWMLGKALRVNWFMPLIVHSLIHSVFTLIIVLTVNYTLWWLALVDLVLHATIDRIKGSPNMLNRFSIDEKGFWISLGVDQMLHRFTHYWFIYILVTL